MDLKMTSNTELVKHRFAQELIRCCGSHFNTFPSNEQFARDLFLSSKYKLKVSREAVRKWFKGETFPDLDLFLYLIEWLNLDVVRIFSAVDIPIKKPLSQDVEFLTFDGKKNITTKHIDAVVLLLTALKESPTLEIKKNSKRARFN